MQLNSTCLLRCFCFQQSSKVGHPSFSDDFHALRAILGASLDELAGGGNQLPVPAAPFQGCVINSWTTTGDDEWRKWSLHESTASR